MNLQGMCVCNSHEGGEHGASNTVRSDKADDKAERIDDKLLTALAHVFRPGLLAEIQITVPLERTQSASVDSEGICEMY